MSIDFTTCFQKSECLLIKVRFVGEINSGLSKQPLPQSQLNKQHSVKNQFSKDNIRCIIKVAKVGDIFEYNGADTSTGFRASAIIPIYGR